jgi:hypothetical protein
MLDKAGELWKEEKHWDEATNLEHDAVRRSAKARDCLRDETVRATLETMGFDLGQAQALGDKDFLRGLREAQAYLETVASNPITTE